MSTLTTYEGKLAAQGLTIALVAGRFNDFLVSSLIAGARDAFVRHGGDISHLSLVRVPGAFEIPLICQRLAKSGAVDAVVALGAVIRGSTPHFDFVAAESAKGLQHIMLNTGVPVLNGILTTDTIEQAVERSGTKAGNKGFEAMVGAIEMVQLLKVL